MDCPVLSPDDLGLEASTTLWCYILKEAGVLHGEATAHVAWRITAVRVGGGAVGRRGRGGASARRREPGSPASPVPPGRRSARRAALPWPPRRRGRARPPRSPRR